MPGVLEWMLDAAAAGTRSGRASLAPRVLAGIAPTPAAPGLAHTGPVAGPVAGPAAALPGRRAIIRE